MSAHRMCPSELMQFTGTENWYRHQIVRSILYTDGARYVAQNGGAYWLLDEIALSQHKPEIAAEAFQVWTLTVDDHRGTLICEDGNKNQVFAKAIPFTDFPLDAITLWLTDRTILLPSEY